MSSKLDKLEFFLANIPKCKRPRLIVEPFLYKNKFHFAVMVIDYSIPEGDSQRLKATASNLILEDAIEEVLDILQTMYSEYEESHNDR